jgi:hypothetical protein
MAHSDTYRKWCIQVSQSTPALRRVLLALPSMQLSQRKALVTACRVQSYPHRDSRLWTRLRTVWGSLVHLDPSSQPPNERLRSSVTQSLISILLSCEDVLASSVFSGFLISALHSAPTDHLEDYQEALHKGVDKEILASIYEYRPTELDYRCIFSDYVRDRDRPLAENLEGCPEVAWGVREAFSRVRRSLQNKVLYPRCGSKNVGAQVERNFWRDCPDPIRSEIFEETQETGVTTTSLQKLEYWEGIRVEGPVEMRSSWKYSQIKPRVYFAQGGDTFHTSKYVQPIFNELLDSLEVVHTRNRYEP